MKVITFQDILDLHISPATCYTWVEETLKNKDRAVLPAKISMKPKDEVFCNVMPSMITEGDGHCVGGVKIVSRYPDRVPSLDSQIHLFDGDSGETLAVMDGNWITAMRTGSVAAHSIQLLAKNQFTELGIIGLGNTARAALLVLAHMVQDRKLHVKLYKYKGQEAMFAQRFAAYENLTFSFVESYEEVVRDSQVVISAATYFEGDICRDECYQEGVLVVPIHTRGFSNCDLFFDKVYGDDYHHIHHFRYFDRFRHFAEVADIVNGKDAGRTSQKERILAYNIGISIHDVYFAWKIYQVLGEQKSLQELSLQAPKEKFWV